MSLTRGNVMRNVILGDRLGGMDMIYTCIHVKIYRLVPSFWFLVVLFSEAFVL